MEIDTDRASKMELDDDAFGNAIEAANEASHAGLDPHEQLKAGVQAYFQTLLVKYRNNGRFIPITYTDGQS